jgi:hypothetical protein
MMLVFPPRPLELGQRLFVRRVLRSARSRNVLEKDRQQHAHHARQHYQPLRGGVRREGLDDAVGRLMTADSFSCSLAREYNPGRRSDLAGVALCLPSLTSRSHMALNRCRLRLLKLPLGDVLSRTRPSCLGSASGLRFRGGCRRLLVGRRDSSRSFFTLLHVAIPPPSLRALMFLHHRERRGDYWMTSSARPSTDGGIVRPRAFAVLRLMTISNSLGCCTGRSLGLTPFRTLST